MVAVTHGKILTSRWKPFGIYHPEQQRLIKSLWEECYRNYVILAGRGSGKTEIAKRFLVSRLPVPKPWTNPKYFYGAPTIGQAKRIAWQDLLDLIPDDWIEGGKDGPNVSVGELTIRTIFGSSLHVIGLKESRRAEGTQWDGGAMDEFSDVIPSSYDISIAPALTWRNGFCLQLGVPKRHGIGAANFRNVFKRGQDANDPAYESFWWESEGIVPQAALDEARRTLDAKDYREQFKASWETSGGAAFHAFSTANVRKCQYHRDRPLIVGCDFNVDPMAWVVGHKYDNSIEWIDELWLRDTNTQEAAGYLGERWKDHQGGMYFYGDASGGARKTSSPTLASDWKLISEHPKLKRLGVTLCVDKNNPVIHERLTSCNSMFKNAVDEIRMFIDPSCVHLIDDLEKRGFKHGTSDLDDRGDIGHITDAMGYAVHKLFPIKIPTEGKVGVLARKGS